MRGEKSGLALKQLDALLRKFCPGLLGSTTTQAIDGIMDQLLYSCPIGLDLGDTQTIRGCVTSLREPVCDIEQSFGGVAAVIEAGSAELTALHQRDAQTLFIHRGNSRAACSPGSNHQQVILLFSHR